MRPFARPLNLALCLIAFTSFAPLGCNSAGGQGSGSGSSLSGPLTMLPDYQARAPRTCTSVTKPPSLAQASVMVQCSSDQLSALGLSLLQDVKIEMGTSRPFVYQTDAGLPGIDLTAKVYPLRGSYTSYFCRAINNMSPAGKSCIRSAVPTAQGWCWKTSFGDYKCLMQGGIVPKAEQGMPAPQAF